MTHATAAPDRAALHPVTAASAARGVAPRRRPRAIALAAAAVAAVVALPLARAAFPPPLRARQYAAATDHPDASRAAAEVLRGGGNAVDAAIAAALALGVVSPASSGFGGGGFATICWPDGRCTFVDFRETAPAALTPEHFTRAPADARASAIGGLAVGVPGEPAGFVEMSRRFGRVPLARAVAPAVALARRGAPVSDHVAQAAALERLVLARDPLLASLFLPGGAPIEAGARLRRPRLAATLERYGREGRRYVDGAFAAAIERAVRAQGGVLTAADVRAYQPVERAPLRRAFRGAEIVTAPPPSAGGIILLQTLALLDGLPAAQLSPGSSAYDHALAEAFRAGFDDRARYVGDPGAPAPPATAAPAPPNVADALLDPARIARRRAAFNPQRATPVVIVEPARDHGTTHLCVVDAQGMTVSLTTTVNLRFGARIAAQDLDVILNDEIDDFSLGTPGNNFGLAVARPNALVPGRRPISSMTPTIVLQGNRPAACAGASGGPRIATATTQVVLNLLVHGMDPSAAVSAPRIHHQGAPDALLVDREVPEDVRAGLRARGHAVTETTEPLAVAQALVVRERNGQREVLAASDPRKGGAPAGQ